jgi:hypothetical protein
MDLSEKPSGEPQQKDTQMDKPVLSDLADELSNLEFETFEIQDYTELSDDLMGSTSCSCSSTSSTCSSTTSTTSCCA